MPRFQRFELSAPLFCLSLVVLIGAPQPAATAAMYSPTLGYLKIVHLTLSLSDSSSL